MGSSGIFTWAQSVGDRWIIQVMSSQRDVGLYSILYQVGYYPMMMSALVLTQYGSPIIFSQAGDATRAEAVQEARRTVSRLTWVMFGIAAISIGVSWMMHREIFLTILTPEYAEVSRLLPWIVLSGGLYAIGQIASVIAKVAVSTRRLFVPNVVTSLMACVLYFLGAARYGIDGVAYANVVFGATYCLWMVGIARRIK
jgi:O-antigen/teichoic acid export membrane protein